MHALWRKAGIFAALLGAVAPRSAGADQNGLVPSAQAAVSTPAHELTRADVDAWLDGIVPFGLERGDIAGGVVVVVKDGRVLTARGFGYANVARRQPVDPERTLFRPGSVSKLFTWTAVMQQVERGTVDLDADINRYLDFRIPAFEGKPITMRNLMTHTPGFEESIRGLIASKRPKAPLGDVLKRWVPTRIFAPGEVPAYSNYGAALAGYIVERVTRMPFESYVDRHIMRPIGAGRATFRQPLPSGAQPFMSAGYLLGSGKPEPFEILDMAPAGGLSASGTDMARFMIAHLGGGGPLLRPEAAQMMHDTTLATLPRINRAALGFYEQNRNGRRIIAHAGDTRMFHSAVWLFPNERVGIFFSVNSQGNAGAIHALRATLIAHFADRYFPAPRLVQPARVVDAAKHARMVAGNYYATRRSASNFLRAGAVLGQVAIGIDESGGLVVPFADTVGGAPREWVEVEPFVWRERNGTALLAAKVENGRVVRIGDDDLGAIIQLERVPWTFDRSWFFPASLAALGLIAVVALSGPIGAISRRVHGKPLSVTPGELLRRRVVLVLAGATLGLVGAWIVLLSLFSDGVSGIDGQFDAWFAALQIAGPIVIASLVAAACVTLWRSVTLPASWMSPVAALLFLGASLMIGWAMSMMGFLGYGLNY